MFLECADLSALWSLATWRQQRRDRSRRTKAETGHRTPKLRLLLSQSANSNFQEAADAPRNL